MSERLTAAAAAAALMMPRVIAQIVSELLTAAPDEVAQQQEQRELNAARRHSVNLQVQISDSSDVSSLLYSDEINVHWMHCSSSGSSST